MQVSGPEGLRVVLEREGRGRTGGRDGAEHVLYPHEGPPLPAFIILAWLVRASFHPMKHRPQTLEFRSLENVPTNTFPDNLFNAGPAGVVTDTKQGWRGRVRGWPRPSML